MLPWNLTEIKLVRSTKMTKIEKANRNVKKKSKT